MILNSLQGLPAFLIYFVTAAAFCALFLIAYTWVTPNKEFDLIFREHNATAALALGMSLIGFALPLASAIYNSANIADCAVWGVVALICQLLAYFVAYLVHPNLGESIRNNVMSAGLWVGFVSLAAGLLSAAAMTY